MSVAALVALALAAAPDAHDARREEAWQAAQWTMVSGAAAALDRAGARAAHGDARLAALEQARAALVSTMAAGDQAILDVARRTDAAAVSELPALRRERARQAAALLAMDDRIAADYPAFAELVRPQAVASDQARRLLDQNEGLLLILPDVDATFVFVLTREGFDWYRSNWGVARLDAAVRTLRAAIARPTTRAVPPAFDYDMARALYEQLLTPADALLASKEVLTTVTAAPLTALPLNLLVTDVAAAKAGRGGWLIDRWALATLPAVSSLVAVRCFLAPRAQVHHGCPSVKGARQTAVAPTRFFGAGAPVLGGVEPAEDHDLPAFDTLAQARDRGLAMLRALPELPGSRRELDTLARAMGSDAIVLTDRAASEGAVRGSPFLAKARYVVLSTHGLLAGQLGAGAEPGLVFTPPQGTVSSSEDDGFLTASEAAALTLTADIVALSACNTAGGANSDSGEGLADLSRSFFYAGARSLLVSHWEANDAATAALMVDTFLTLDAARGGGRAKALRSAILRVRDDAAHPEWRRPRYWAAFTLSGDAR